MWKMWKIERHFVVPAHPDLVGKHCWFVSGLLVTMYALRTRHTASLLWQALSGCGNSRRRRGFRQTRCFRRPRTPEAPRVTLLRLPKATVSKVESPSHGQLGTWNFCSFLGQVPSFRWPGSSKEDVSFISETVPIKFISHMAPLAAVEVSLMTSVESYG